MRELRLALASSYSISHPRRHPTTSRRWPTRIEKARSTHTSPAHESRRRAWSGTSQTQAPFVNTYGMNPPTIHQVYSEHHYPQRPLSWHSTYQVSPYNSSPMDHNLHTQYSVISRPVLSNAFPTYNLPELYMQTESLSTSSTSSLGLPNTSPIWYGNSEQHSFMIGSQQHCSSEMNLPNWQASIKSVETSTASKTVISQHANIDPHMHVPDSELLVDAEEDGGEILVGLGLYDGPPEAEEQSIYSLKLTESWKPPPENDNDADENIAEIPNEALSHT
jgi:hypothetical protein